MKTRILILTALLLAWAAPAQTVTLAQLRQTNVTSHATPGVWKQVSVTNGQNVAGPGPLFFYVSPSNSVDTVVLGWRSNTVWYPITNGTGFLYTVPDFRKVDLTNFWFMSGTATQVLSVQWLTPP